MSGRRSGFTDEDNRIAKLLMAEFERVEHRPVTASWVATFADMARAVRLDREQSQVAVVDDRAAEAAHRVALLSHVMLAGPREMFPTTTRTRPTRAADQEDDRG